MPIIQCDIREGRTKAQKEALARELTRVVHETLDAPIEYIYVLIRETPGFHHIKAGTHLPDFAPKSDSPGKPKRGAKKPSKRKAQP
ncbi:MAG: tautomerase family protein [Chloroherpetonaceae bacterium]